MSRGDQDKEDPDIKQVMKVCVHVIIYSILFKSSNSCDLSFCSHFATSLIVNGSVFI